MSLFWSDCGPERLMNEIEIYNQKLFSLSILTTEGSSLDVQPCFTRRLEWDTLLSLSMH